MKQRFLALAVLLGLAAALTAPALAESSKPSVRKDTEVENSAAGPDDKDDRAAYVADEVGFISFENIERRMYKSNLKIEMMDETMAALSAVDYTQVKQELTAALQMLDGQMEALKPALEMEPIGAQFAISTLESQARELESQLEAIKNGELQDEAYAAEAQLESSQKLLVTAGETMFIAIKAMETQQGALQRQLTALNRTVEEMELRYSMGQISTLQLMEIKAGRSSLVSGLKTLEMNISTYKAQLEQFLGAKITGEITLGAVPKVTAEQIAAMDLEEDWKSCRRKNYAILSAQLAEEKADRALEQAEKQFDEEHYQYKAAESQADAASATHADALQTAELQLYALHAQVLDKQQIVEAASISLQAEELSYQAAELKYQQGTISHNALLSEADALTTAREAVENAENDLFAAYNTYCWAAESGVLS